MNEIPSWAAAAANDLAETEHALLNISLQATTDLSHHRYFLIMLTHPTEKCYFPTSISSDFNFEISRITMVKNAKIGLSGDA